MNGAALVVYRKVMWDQRLSLSLWAVALGAVSVIYISFWPSMGTGEMVDMLDQLPEALVKGMGYDRIGTPGGYISSTVYGLVAVALLLIYAITSGARVLAGHEEDGTLELELTAPVSRRGIYLARFGALATSIAVLSGVVGVATLLLIAAFDMGVPAVNVVAATLGLVLFLLGVGTIGFATGAASGRRSLALAVGSAFAVVAYMLNAIGAVVDAGWMTAISPFSWYLLHEPLDNGFDWPGLLALSVIPVLAGVAGLWAFERNDRMV